jgi:hypothetical protein
MAANVLDVLAGGAVTPGQSPSDFVDSLIDVVVLEIPGTPDRLLQFVATQQYAGVGDKEEKQIESRGAEFQLAPAVEEHPVRDIQSERAEAVKVLWFVQHKTFRKQSVKFRTFHRSLLGKARLS